MRHALKPYFTLAVCLGLYAVLFGALGSTLATAQSGDEFYSSDPPTDSAARPNCVDRMNSRSHNGTPVYIPASDMGKRVTPLNEPQVLLHQLYRCSSSCYPNYLLCSKNNTTPVLQGGATQDTYNSNDPPYDGGVDYRNYRPVKIQTGQTDKPPQRKTYQGTAKKTPPAVKTGDVYVPTQVTTVKTGYIQGKPIPVKQTVTKNVKVHVQILNSHKHGDLVHGDTELNQDNPYYTHVWGRVHRSAQGDSFTVTQVKDTRGNLRKLNMTTKLTTPKGK